MGFSLTGPSWPRAKQWLQPANGDDTPAATRDTVVLPGMPEFVGRSCPRCNRAMRLQNTPPPFRTA